jgi:FtsP/CotA-like multicopper oxidase with cupredoxin domain
MPKSGRTAGRDRLVIAIVLTVGILGAFGWYWWQSLVPSTYSVLGMGYADFGGGRVDAQHARHAHNGSAGSAATQGDVSVASLTGPQDRTPDVAVTLTARKESVKVGDGDARARYTLNHSSPGPVITARQGDLVQVTLVNESIPDGTALHWHGVDVPNAEDGVAGVTQDAVAPGEQHVYRFEATDTGTYWYHSHQVSHEQVRGGLFGALVITPRDSALADVDVVAPLHSYSGKRTLAGRTGEQHHELAPSATARVRLIATDPGPVRVWVSGAPYRLVAVDGRDLHEPAPVQGKTVVIGAGGRIDIAVTGPADGSAVRVDVGGGTSLVLGPRGAKAPVTKQPKQELDLLTYGSPAPVAFDVSSPDRRFEYRIGRRPALLDGRPGFFWTINGGLYPDVPMYVVDEGDVVVMTIKNNSGDVHPMHLHGHHALVLSRNGTPATGSPWWVDSLNVKNNETYEIALLADNPGIWMDHCHNLQHASQGLVTHLAYAEVSEPFQVGGEVGNKPE